MCTDKENVTEYTTFQRLCKVCARKEYFTDPYYKENFKFFKVKK